MKNIIWNNTWKQWISRDGRFIIVVPEHTVDGCWVSIDTNRHCTARHNTVVEARQRCEDILASEDPISNS